MPPPLQPGLSSLPQLLHPVPRSLSSLPGRLLACHLTVITPSLLRRVAIATALSPSRLQRNPCLPTLGPAMRTLLVAKVSKREWVASLTSPNCPPQLQFPELGPEIGASALPFPPLPQAHSVQPGSCLRPVQKYRHWMKSKRLLNKRINATIFHYVFSNVTSNCLPDRMRSHIGCICSFLHCAF